MNDKRGGNNWAMNIYFSCSLTGGRRDESVYKSIVDHLLAIGHDVPTAHLAHPEVMDLERVADAREVYERDMAWIDGCDMLIAEVSTPSHGVGYEIAVALMREIPVLCCYRESEPVSKMITGNDSKMLGLCTYRGTEDVLKAVDDFLQTLQGV
jgi:nucleoside 2-deoxyribosyltransferase